MDIGSGKGPIASDLSNFTPRTFVFENVLCNSIEGPLQSFKTPNIDVQVHMCTLVGRTAKFAGGKKKWWLKQELYWAGVVYKRDSDEYQNLLDRLYQAAYDGNPKFRATLAKTRGVTFTHSIGKRKKEETVLTIQEFCSRLTKLRDTGKLISVTNSISE